MVNTRMNEKRFDKVQVVRGMVQFISFLLAPGLFIRIFSAIGELWDSVLEGSFTFGEQAVNLLLVAATMLVMLIWGRFFCGFVCSFGAMQDLLWQGGRRLPFRLAVSERTDRTLKYLKYGVLVFVVLGVWTFGVTDGNVWSPWTVFGAYARPWKGVPASAIWLSAGGALLAGIIVGSLLIERFFCKYLCPLGAVFSLVSRFRFFRMKRAAGHCDGSCRVCTRKCAMSVPIYRYDRICSGECINCMKCTTACAKGNIRAETLPAVSGTMAAAALMGVAFVGTIPRIGTVAEQEVNSSLVAEAITVGRFRDGEYTGTADGFRGQTSVRVTVSGGAITDVSVTVSNDDREFLEMAKRGVITAILEAQDTDIAAVSGATFSSRGIINAVTDALGVQLAAGQFELAPETTAVSETTPAPETVVTSEAAADPDTSVIPETASASETTAVPEPAAKTSGFADGVYTGKGTGYRGTTEVSVTVENGVITDITVVSFADDSQFFNKAKSGVISAILAAQGTNVSTVSGATYSSNSLLEAVSNALGQEFTNPNASAGGKKRK